MLKVVEGLSNHVNCIDLIDTVGKMPPCKSQNTNFFQVHASYLPTSPIHCVIKQVQVDAKQEQCRLCLLTKAGLNLELGTRYPTKL